jgi:hypothetical protein
VQPGAAEEAREIVPAVDGQELGGRRIAEDARLLFGEDRVTGECTKKALQGVGVGTACGRELGDRPRFPSEPARDVELGDEAERE